MDYFSSFFSVVFTAIVIVDSLHTIEEGNVGIYFVQGALGKEFALKKQDKIMLNTGWFFGYFLHLVRPILV